MASLNRLLNVMLSLYLISVVTSMLIQPNTLIDVVICWYTVHNVTWTNLHYRRIGSNVMFLQSFFFHYVVFDASS